MRSVENLQKQEGDNIQLQVENLVIWQGVMFIFTVSPRCRLYRVLFHFFVLFNIYSLGCTLKPIEG